MTEDHNDIRIILSDLPVQPLINAVQESWWDEITIRQQYPGSHHRDTQCIFLRGPRSFMNFFDTSAKDYPHLDELMPVLMPVLDPLFNHLQCPPDSIGRVMLVKLRARGHVQPHIDTGPYADAFVRHHICLTSNPNSLYVCGKTEARPKPGQAFWFDHHKQHAAYNYGAEDRVHLIVDTLAVTPADPPIKWSQLCPNS